jgi:pyruvate formate lyase activating enzyme
MTELTAAGAITGTILHLQRLSTEDGPGIRTTVFYKGCPLHCAWCHNPESLKVRAEVQWYKNRCIDCDSCFEACGVGGLTRTDDGIERDRTICTACGDCVEACPTGAMEKLGTVWSVDELVDELVKDRTYFEHSNGGVTLSGGEPSLQPAFTLELMRKLRQRGIKVALDTCGLCTWETLEMLVQEADLVLYDVKLIDTVEHEHWTGVPNERIIENLKKVKAMIRVSDKSLWIRTPLIPGATFTQENLRGISAFLAKYVMDTVDRWELCAFNNLCRDKYERLGLKWSFAETPLMTKTDLEQAGEWAKAGGFDAERTFVTGAAKVEPVQEN